MFLMETTTRLVGVFGVMDLRLTLSPYGIITLFVDFNEGEAKGLGDINLEQARVLLHEHHLPDMLKGVVLHNTLANGSGKFWTFGMSGGIDFSGAEEVPGQLQFTISLVPQGMKKKYSRLKASQDEAYVPRKSYRGAMYVSTIERKLDRKALRENLLEKGYAGDPDEGLGRVDLVTYFRERNLTTAAHYCPDMDLEEIPRPPVIYIGFQ